MHFVLDKLTDTTVCSLVERQQIIFFIVLDLTQSVVEPMIYHSILLLIILAFSIKVPMKPKYPNISHDYSQSIMFTEEIFTIQHFY